MENSSGNWDAEHTRRTEGEKTLSVDLSLKSVNSSPPCQGTPATCSTEHHHLRATHVIDGVHKGTECSTQEIWAEVNILEEQISCIGGILALLFLEDRQKWGRMNKKVNNHNKTANGRSNGNHEDPPIWMGAKG